MIFILVLLLCASYFQAKVSTNTFDRYIIACHTTDFECFKRQYTAMRDQILFGNEDLGLGMHEAHQYEYGRSGTCVRLSGMEESELVAVSVDSSTKEYSIVLELPLRIQQVKKGIKPCAKPERAFEGVGPHKGPMKRFTGNVTVQVSYPYTLLVRNGETYIMLEEENLDVVLDIPDLSHFHKNSRLEAKLYEWSEWAYHVVQHTDLAQRLIMPITSRLRHITDRIPLKRFLLLYPEEKYSTIQFMYAETLEQ